MSFELTFSDPSWYLIICLLAGAFYAALLYFRSKEIEESGAAKWMKYMLAGFRFVVVSLIAILLLNPFLRYVSQYVERPKVIIALDDSRSVALQMDSTELAGLQNDLKELKEGLSSKFDVVDYTFGENPSDHALPSFSQRTTDIGMMLNEIFKGWKGQNVCATILVSDGIDNQGVRPEIISKSIGHPIYTVALGDTSKRMDLRIAEVRTNAIAYLGNSFPLVVDVAGRKLKGETFELTIDFGGKRITTRNILIPDDDYFMSFEFQLDAGITGTQEIVANVSRKNGEINHLNNRSIAYIDVIDSRQKVLVLGSSPHPDLGAIRRTLAPFDNYEVSIQVAKDPQPEMVKGDDVSLVILHQLPAGKSGVAFVRSLIDRKIPILFFIGRKSDLRSLNALDIGVKMDAQQRSFNKALPYLADDFVLFELSADTRKAIIDWPPLDVPFGRPAGGELQTLLKQQIGSVKTDQSLLAFIQRDDWRTGMIFGEGFWKWSMQDNHLNENIQASTELLRKSIQYLSVRSDKRKFRVYPDKRDFYENDIIGFQAELYNESFESVNDPDVNLVLRKDDDQFEYVFSKSATGYKLKAGMLPAGEYTYKATVKLGGISYDQSGRIVIRELQKESLTLEADHHLLKRISNTTGGGLFYKDQLDQLAEQLNMNNNLKPVAYSESTFRELLHMKWLFFLLAGLLSLEWAIRKWNGGY